MSNSESFIEEVTEEVRKDQLFGYMRKYGWIAVLVVLLIVGGTAYSEFRKAQVTNPAQAAGDKILAALEIDDDAERAAALQAIEATGPAAAITGLLAASDLTETGDIAGAAAALDVVALDENAPQVYRDLAALKSVMVQGDTLAIEERRAMLSGLAAAGAPFRLVAQEQLALLSVEAGDIDAATTQFLAIAQDAETTHGLRVRAFSMIEAMAVTLKNFSAIVLQRLTRKTTKNPTKGPEKGNDVTRKTVSSFKTKTLFALALSTALVACGEKDIILPGNGSISAVMRLKRLHS